jgi:hypothetical protein
MAIFNSIKFAAWVLRVPNGLNTPLGISLAAVFSTAVGIENTVIRGRNLVRGDKSRSRQVTPAPSLNNISESAALEAIPELTPNEIADNATFFYAGTELNSRIKSISYKILQLQCALYLCNSAMGGFLSEFSLAQLVAKTPGLEFDSTCEDTHSSYPIIISVHLAALYASYSSILSFLRSNLFRIRRNYAHYIHQGHWREIGLASYLETLLGVSVGTIGIIYSNKHTWELLEQSSLCHINAIPVPELLIQLQSWEACVANFFVSVASTLPAIHKRRSNTMRKEITTLLEEVPSFKRWNPLIQISFVLSALNTGLGVALFTAKLPETVHDDMTDYSYNWWMIVTGIFVGIYALTGQFSNSNDAYIQELEETKLDMAEERSIANPSLHSALLEDDSPISTSEDSPTSAPITEHDHIIDVDNENIKTYSDPMTQDQHESAVPARTLARQHDKLSVAPSVILFGESNPANPNMKKKANKYVIANDTTIDAAPLLDEIGDPVKAVVRVVCH